MELSFSRGFSPGWLGGCNHKMLVPGRSSAKRGVLVGKVIEVRSDSVVIAATKPVAAGDGVVFEGDRERGDEQGGRVYEVTPRGANVELAFGRGAIDFSRLQIGQQIWKTDDPQLTARLRKTFAGKPRRRVWLDVHVEAGVGKLLRVSARGENGATCAVDSAKPLAAAEKHPLTEGSLREQLARLGGTVYELRNLSAQIDGQPMAPLSVLGKLRHEMVRRLDESLRSRPARQIQTRTSGELLPLDRGQAESADRPPELRILCRSLDQLAAVLDCGIRSVMVDFADIREYREATATAKNHNADILLATPRIQKPDEFGIFLALAKHAASGFLVRNLAGAAFCAQRSIPFVCDFSLNAANEWTVDLLRSLGARRVTVSYDLNRDQLFDLVDAAPPACLEVVIHQHMPMFHMEHCVFCAVLSPGTNKHNCGRPCDVHAVKLRDRVGMEHTLTADVGCRNTLFNAIPQSAAEAVPQLLAKGLRDFRIELLTENREDAKRLVALYRELLAGRVTGKHVWERLNASNRVGVTRGTLEERRNPLAIL
jgi:putative protease